MIDEVKQRLGHDAEEDRRRGERNGDEDERRVRRQPRRPALMRDRGCLRYLPTCRLRTSAVRFL
ncbi:MAG: hypothetical protein JO120_06110 [Solirubrobacterales bacterium]|nr:hypothetical protein [Solirubrobacterales bacterium]